MKRYTSIMAVFLALFVLAPVQAREDEVRQEDRVRIKAEDDSVLKAKLDNAKNLLKSRVEVKNNTEVEIEDGSNRGPGKNGEERKAELKEAIKNIKKEAIHKRKEFVIARFTQAINLIEKHQARVKALIDSQVEKGKDVGDAKATLKVSVDALVEAKASLEKLKSMSATVETEASALRAQAKVVEEDIKDSRDALIKTIKNLIPRMGVKVESKTSVQTQ